MCAIYGFLNYGNKVHHRVLLKLIRELSIAAESRGTDATGISYVKGGEIITFKKAKPAHKLHLYFPHGTKAVIVHNRMTTQGSEKKNYNNHPFEGKTASHSFAFAHNGVLYNEAKLQREYSLPETPIETDSYTAVQVLETFDGCRRMMFVVQRSLTFAVTTASTEKMLSCCSRWATQSVRLRKC